MSIPTLTDADVALVRQVVQAELTRFNDAFEQRLAKAIRKGYDQLLAENEDRLRQIEEDLAKLLRHTGLA